MEKNPDVCVYMHGIPCYGALFVPCSYSKTSYYQDGKPVVSELVNKLHPAKYRAYAPTIYSVMQQLLGDQFSERVMCSQNLPNSDTSHSTEKKPIRTRFYIDHPSALVHILGNHDAVDQFHETCYETIDKKTVDKQKILHQMKEIRDNDPEYKGKILIGAEECNIYFPLSKYNHNSFLGIYKNKTPNIENSQNYFKAIYGPEARQVKNDFINKARQSVNNSVAKKCKR